MASRPRIAGFLPARMASSRFPGKPLADIHGMSMIEHCWRRGRMCKKLDELYVATCDEEIRRAAERFGAKVIMTGDHHKRCIDRIAEAAAKVECDVAAILQGDEPMAVPEMLDEAIGPLLAHPDRRCVTLIAPIPTVSEFNDFNCVKVICDLEGRLMYQSRAPIPTGDPKKKPMYKQIGVYVFRKDFLLEFHALKPGPLEASENSDLIRACEHRLAIHTAVTRHATHGVDTPEDLEAIKRAMAKDPLMAKYLPARGAKA